MERMGEMDEDLRSILANGRPEWDLSYGDAASRMGPELRFLV
jgi:hypothetical protein